MGILSPESDNALVGCSAELAQDSCHRRIPTACMGPGLEVDDVGGDANVDTPLSFDSEEAVVGSPRTANVLGLSEFAWDGDVAKDTKGR